MKFSFKNVFYVILTFRVVPGTGFDLLNNTINNTIESVKVLTVKKYQPSIQNGTESNNQVKNESNASAMLTTPLQLEESLSGL